MLSLGQREMKFVSVKQGLQTADCIQGIRQRNFCEPSQIVHGVRFCSKGIITNAPLFPLKWGINLT